MLHIMNQISLKYLVHRTYSRTDIGLLVFTQSTHLSIETYDCSNKMHNFLFISRTCEGPSEPRGHIDFPSFHAVTLGLPILSFIFKDNARFFLPLFSVFFSFFHPPPLQRTHIHTFSKPAQQLHPPLFPSLTLKIVIQP